MTKTVSITVIASVLLITQTIAAPTAPPVKTFTSKSDKEHLHSYIQKIQNKKISHKKLVHLYTILENTNEYYIHNMNGVTGNVVYISKDGHQEAVYNKEGKLVKDGINDGSYNYYHPHKSPLKHYYLDIHPWLLYGSTPKDPTTKKERIFSYLSDFEGGLRKALDLNAKKTVNYSIKFDSDQIHILAHFLRIIESSHPSLFKLFEKKSVSDKDILDCLNQLEVGFRNIYIRTNKKSNL